MVGESIIVRAFPVAVCRHCEGLSWCVLDRGVKSSWTKAMTEQGFQPGSLYRDDPIWDWCDLICLIVPHLI